MKNIIYLLMFVILVSLVYSLTPAPTDPADFELVTAPSSLFNFDDEANGSLLYAEIGYHKGTPTNDDNNEIVPSHPDLGSAWYSDSSGANGEYIVLNDTGTPPTASDDYSYCFWVKSLSDSGQYTYFVGEGGSSLHFMRLSHGVEMVFTYVGAGYEHVTLRAEEAVIDTWEHICVVRDITNSSMNFYRNGTLTNTTTIDTPRDWSGAYTVINGVGYANAGDHLIIDESMIWEDYALHENEVKNIYDGNFEAAIGTLNITWLAPTANDNHTYSTLKNYTFNVTCTGGDCGNVNVTLDPEEPVTYSSSFGNPNLPDWSYVNVTENPDFIIVDNTHYTFKFRKGAAGYNEIWQNGSQIVEDERFVLEYLFKEPDTFKQRGTPINVSYERIEDGYVQVKRFYTDYEDTWFYVVYDIFGSSLTKITVYGNVTPDDYRVGWEVSGINKDYVNESEHRIKFWNEDIDKIAFDFFDVYSEFGNITEYSLEQTAQGRKMDMYFHLGNLSDRLYLDPLFGHDSIEGTADNIEGDISGSVYTITETGTADTITAYMSGSGAHTVECAIYKTNNDLLAETYPDIPIEDADWYTFTLTTNPELTVDTEYVLVCGADTEFGTNNMYYIDTPSSGIGRVTTTDNSPWPDPITFTENDNVYSIYCNYTVPPPPPKGIINNTPGSIPFYHNGTTINYICGSMNDGDECTATFWVNATGTIGSNWTFYGTASSESVDVNSINSSEINITITSEDSCSCPDTGDWHIIDGDICTLNTECILTPNAFRVIEGSMTILPDGIIRASSCFTTDGEILFVSDGGKLYCT